LPVDEHVVPRVAHLESDALLAIAKPHDADPKRLVDVFDTRPVIASDCDCTRLLHRGGDVSVTVQVSS
jgi:hypothetical protein